MYGEASAPVAISLVNAIPAGRGAAAAIDRSVTASVRLDPETTTVTGTVADGRDVDTTLIERCVAATTARFGAEEGGSVETSADVPPSVGLKTSSAAANATIAATLDALGCWDDVEPLSATRFGVEVAKAVGVTVTGAFDDAAASMLGGLVITDNETDTLLDRRRLRAPVVVLIPGSRIPSGTVDVAPLRAVAPLGELAADRVSDGDIERGMAVNGMAVAAALDLSFDPLAVAMEHTPAVSYSGTGPAVAAIGDAAACDAVADTWESMGSVLEAKLDTTGTSVS